MIYSEMGLLLTDWLYWEHKITDREVACAFKCFESPLASAPVNMSGSFGIITFKYDFRADNYSETVLSLSRNRNVLWLLSASLINIGIDVSAKTESNHIELNQKLYMQMSKRKAFIIDREANMSEWEI